MPYRDILDQANAMDYQESTGTPGIACEGCPAATGSVRREYAILSCTHCSWADVSPVLNSEEAGGLGANELGSFPRAKEVE